MRPAAARGLLLCWTSATAACTWVACSNTDFTRNATADDGGPDDVAAEAAGGDGGSDSADARSDAWIPCALRGTDPAHFCDDFDTLGPVNFNWTRPVKTTTGALGETDAALTPPRAVVLSVGADSAGNKRMQLQKERDPAVTIADKSRVFLSFWIRVDKSPYLVDSGADYVHFAVIEFDTPGCATSNTSKQRAIELSLYANNSIQIVGKGLNTTSDVPPDAGPDGGSFCPDFIQADAPVQVSELLQLGRFVHVTIEMTKASCPNRTGGCLTLQIDERTPVRLPIGNPFAHADKLTLDIGPYLGGAFSDTVFAYDNVTFDIE